MVKYDHPDCPILTESLNFRGLLSTFGAKNTKVFYQPSPIHLKVGHLRPKTVPKRLPKQLKFIFEKGQKTTLLTSRIVKNYPLECQILTEISTFVVIYQPSELKY